MPPEGGRDLERKLTAKGHKQAARVAEWLAARLPSTYTVLCQPCAARARRRTRSARATRSSERLAPGAAPSDILEAAGWPSHKGRGGRGRPPAGPGAGGGGAALPGAEADWSVKKGGLWWLSNRERDGEAQVVVRAVLAPDLL